MPTKTIRAAIYLIYSNITAGLLLVAAWARTTQQYPLLGRCLTLAVFALPVATTVVRSIYRAAGGYLLMLKESLKKQPPPAAATPLYAAETLAFLIHQVLIAFDVAEGH